MKNTVLLLIALMFATGCAGTHHEHEAPKPDPDRMIIEPTGIEITNPFAEQKTDPSIKKLSMQTKLEAMKLIAQGARLGLDRQERLHPVELVRVKYKGTISNMMVGQNFTHRWFKKKHHFRIDFDGHKEPKHNQTYICLISDWSVDGFQATLENPHRHVWIDVFKMNCKQFKLKHSDFWPR